jgi:hypothetical protein
VNIALGTLIILFLLSPGFIIRYTFLKGPYSRKNYKPSVTTEIFWAIIPAVFLQLSGLYLLQALGFAIDFKILYLLLTGSDKIVDFSLLSANLGGFLFYFLVISFLAAGMGFIARWLVMHWQLDKKLGIFKINNEWYYLFSGRLLDKADEIDFIQVDTLVQTTEGVVIYCGVLNDFYLTSDGGIDRLYLVNVYRRKFADDYIVANLEPKKLDDRYYNMPGDYLVIFGQTLINLNLTYYKLKENN